MSAAPRTIVGEVSVNWGPEGAPPSHLISCRFETLIAVNLARGYRLVSWRISRVVVPLPAGYGINETIVAVFDATGEDW